MVEPSAAKMNEKVVVSNGNEVGSDVAAVGAGAPASVAASDVTAAEAVQKTWAAEPRAAAAFASSPRHAVSSCN